MIIKTGNAAKETYRHYKVLRDEIHDGRIYDYETDDGAVCLIRKKDKQCLYVAQHRGNYILVQGDPTEISELAKAVKLLKKDELEGMAECALAIR